jgi:hypothetical protein
MGFDAQDKEIVRLLTKLKETDGKYPPDLFAARRQGYLKQMGEIGLGIGAGLKIKNALNSTKAPALSSVSSTILESALLIAIVAETGTVAYFYRDKLADLFQTVTKEASGQEVTPPPVHTELEIQGVTPSPPATATLPSAILSVSPTGTELTSTNTPMPGVVEEDNGTISVNSTPVPNGNNGNHYGQTPKPQRTKEPENHNNQPPRDNSRPTRARSG